MELAETKKSGEEGGSRTSIWVGDQFLLDRVDSSRHVYNLKPGNCSFVN